MGKVLTLKLSELENDHTPLTVDLEIKDEDNNALIATAAGYLPAINEFDIRKAYNEWKEIYKVLDPLLFRGLQVGPSRRYDIHELSNRCRTAAHQLRDRMAEWLGTGDSRWRPIRDQLIQVTHDSTEEIRVLLKTNDPWLQKLPWHKWSILTQNAWNTEIAFSLSCSRTITPVNNTVLGQVRILVILGNPDGLDIESDRQQFHQRFPDDKVVILPQPSPREFLDHLRHKDGWDLLFFSGHSSSPELDRGVLDGELNISREVSISITDFRNAFQEAIYRGLKVAVFNSCDGLGLANALMELNIPQVIVMRELIPDPAARQFLSDFLSHYSEGNSLYSSVREAKERLESLEVNNPGIGQFPGVSWLPVICQNPTQKPPTWDDLRRGGRYLDSVVKGLESKGAKRDVNHLESPQYKKCKFQRVLRLPGAEMNIDPAFYLLQMKGEWNFIFTSFHKITTNEFIRYSRDCFEYCRYELWQNRLSNNEPARWFGFGVKLPANICFSIAIVDQATDAFKQYIQRTNPFDFNNEMYRDAWFSYGIPILYVTDENKIYYFQESLAWLNGEAAWRCVRPVIEKYLHP